MKYPDTQSANAIRRKKEKEMDMNAVDQALSITADFFENLIDGSPILQGDLIVLLANKQSPTVVREAKKLGDDTHIIITVRRG